MVKITQGKGKETIGFDEFAEVGNITACLNGGKIAVSSLVFHKDTVALLDVEGDEHATDNPTGGPWLDAEDCCDFGALLVRIGEAMKAGATAEEALKAVAGEEG